ncbi:phage protein NinX family protein [Chromobacterium phragmitis]|uniref:Phage protein NinX family protein n=1 Tax=Chromobacterium phragmitis TaxID=2202141 RepID=A0ABV0J0P3_9NEIS
MKVKAHELEGVALDWAVAKLRGVALSQVPLKRMLKTYGVLRLRHGALYSPSTEWAQGGPIVEQEQLQLMHMWDCGGWSAMRYDNMRSVSGPNPLTAAMRCYVMNRVDGEIDVPDELLCA